MPQSLTDFTQQLTDSGLMSADELRGFVEGLPGDARPADGEQLAKALVNDKKLTEFQAEQLYAGKGKSLTLGNYFVLDKLGQGGMGVVLKAEHKRLKRVVALKVISPAAIKSPDAVKRFRREVEAVAKLSHPNIVAAFDADEADGTYFLVMEYVAGLDLASFVKQHGPLSVEQAVNCLLQAADGLEFAHRRGIVHRDIKPHNLLLDEADRIRILDMGLARIDNTGSSPLGDDAASLTQSGAIMGTVDYMSPEQALDTKHADQRSDIYSLGCTLWYVLTGQVCYDGNTMMKKLLAHREAPIPSLRSVRADVPARLDAVFRRMVAKRPEDRFASMTDVIAALSDSLNDAASDTDPISVAPPIARVVASSSSDDGSLPSFFQNLDRGHVQTSMSANVRALEAEQTTDPVSLEATQRTLIEARPQEVKGPRRNKMWITGATAAACLCVGLVIAFRGGRGPLPSELSKSGDPQSSSKSDTKNLNKKTPSDARASLAKLPPLPSGPPPETLPGLLVEPPQVAGLGRWQLETTVPRRPMAVTAISPNGKQVALAGHESGEVRIYDVDSWRLVNALVGHPRSVNGIAWNPEGSRIATFSHYDHTVRLWQTDGTPGPVLKHCDAVRMIAWSPDGRFLAAANGNDNNPIVHLWTADGKPYRVLSGHSKGVNCVAWSASSKQLVSGSEDKSLRVWDTDGNTVREINDHDATVSLVALSRTGIIATADGTGSLYFYSGKSSLPREHLKVHPRSMAWHPDGSQLAVGLSNNFIQFWGVHGFAGTQQETAGSLTSLSWSRDGKRLAWAGYHAGVWEPEHKEKSVNGVLISAPAHSLDWHPDGSRFVSSHSDKRLRWWRNGGTVEHSSRTTTAVHSLAWSPDGKWIAGEMQQRLQLWSPDGKLGPLSDLKGVISPTWSADSQQVAVFGANSVVHRWNIDGKLALDLGDPKQRPFAVAWSRTGTIAALTREGTLNLWKADGTAGPVITLPSNKHDLRGLAWSPDGQQLAAVINLGENRIQIWNADGSDGPALKGKVEARCLAWSPDSQRLVVGDASGNLQIWNRSGESEKIFPGHLGETHAVAWSKHNQILSTANDRLIRCWDAATGQPQWITISQEADLSATFAVDGKPLSPTSDADQTLVYLVERPSGRVEALRSSEFQALR